MAMLGAIVSMALAGPIAAAIVVVTLAVVALVASEGCRALARQDATSRLLLAATEQADLLISIVLPDGRVTHANAAFCREVGYERGDVLQQQGIAFLAPQSSSQIAAIEETVRAEGVWRGTLVRLRQDGSTFLSSATVTSLGEHDGVISHFVVVERDVTREAELREQLTHSERLAAAGQLVSGVAHEINNPLQAIIGFTELLIESERRCGSRADLEQVRIEAHRAAKIVRNLLAFVRRSAVERAVVPLNALVQSTVDLRRYELPTLNIALEEQYAEHLPPVVVNIEEIQQVLLNLLLNAEQAMLQANGRGRLLVRTAATSDGLIIEVQDDGPGVPAASAARIFEPFFTTKDVGKGTGLGLSIALGIAQAHGGMLALVASPTGACFRLTLPAGAKNFVPQRRDQTDANPWSAVSGRRALVADDEVPLRKLLQRLLTRRGFAVDVAEDGVQAAALIEQNRYDVVLCDVQMPRMSGTDLYRSVQRRQPGTAANFVMVSGDILNDDLDAFFKRSHIPLLAKPFGAKSLDAVLEEVMTRRVQPPPANAGPRPELASARSGN
jgi:PAS domain S-box-containing protein